MPSCSPDCCLLRAVEIVKIFSEDGLGKVVEIPADMTARDLCQLLVYKSHCVDDNSWALVEHHPLLGLGIGVSKRPRTIACLNREAYSRPSLPTLATLLNGMERLVEISNTDLYLSPLKRLTALGQ